MSEETSQFRQYAEEALRSAVQSKTEKERVALLELARMHAATASELPLGAVYSPTDHRTAR
jgi:hypothetical protein